MTKLAINSRDWLDLVDDETGDDVLPEGLQFDEREPESLEEALMAGSDVYERLLQVRAEGGF